MTEILKKIAYCYYLKFRDLGAEPNRDRDWAYAEKCLNHLLKPIGDSGAWIEDEIDYGEYRVFLKGDCQ